MEPLAVRDEQSLRKTDDLDRRRPSLVGGFGWVQLFVGWGLPFKVVPPEFWNQGISDDGEATTATISCPCGAGPTVELAEYPVNCECERWFFYAGNEVLAFCGPSSDPDPVDPETDDDPGMA